MCDSQLQRTIDRPTATLFYPDRQDNQFFNQSIIYHDEEILSSPVCQSDFVEQLITQLSSRAARKLQINPNSTIMWLGQSCRMQEITFQMNLQQVSNCFLVLTSLSFF